MDTLDLSDREQRALAAIKFCGGFGPWAKGERDELVASLSEKGLVAAGYGVATLTTTGEQALQSIHLKTFLKRAEDQTQFEQQLVMAMSGVARREWDELERQLPNDPAPPRSKMN